MVVKLLGQLLHEVVAIRCVWIHFTHRVRVAFPCSVSVGCYLPKAASAAVSSPIPGATFDPALLPAQVSPIKSAIPSGRLINLSRCRFIIASPHALHPQFLIEAWMVVLPAQPDVPGTFSSQGTSRCVSATASASSP